VKRDEGGEGDESRPAGRVSHGLFALSPLARHGIPEERRAVPHDPRILLCG